MIAPMIAMPRIVVRTPPRRSAVRAHQKNTSVTIVMNNANAVASGSTVIGPADGAAAPPTWATRSYAIEDGAIEDRSANGSGMS